MKIREHLRANVVGYVAVFIALSGTAAALPGQNTVDSRDIINANVRSPDLADGSVTPSELAEGAVTSAAVADDSLTESDIGADAIGFSELAATAFNADIIEQGAAFGIPNDGIQGFEVQNDTLSGDDIDESSLEGVVRGRGDAACCAMRGGTLNTNEPYSASDPSTVFDLGAFELRSTAAGDEDKFDLCNPPDGVTFGASDILYIGGSFGSTSDIRSRTTLPAAGACRTIDPTGASTTAGGDFRLLIPERAWEATAVQGISFGSTGFTIFAINISGQ